MLTITSTITEKYSYRSGRVACDYCGAATQDLRLPPAKKFYAEGEEHQEVRRLVVPPAWRQRLDGRVLRDACTNCEGGDCERGSENAGL